MDGDRGGKPLTVREAAQRLGVHENTIRNWARSGVLPAHRLPGSRFLRFDAADVERLRSTRAALPASNTSHRRTFGPELVDAGQLNQWAETVEAQSLFPQVIRRLLASNPGVSQLSVRSGEGVGAKGWDGEATVRGAAFLPSGNVRFEFGVGKNPRKKAEEDYRTRASQGKQDELRNLIFVFATPRRWLAAEDWVNDRRADGIFKDVRVLDADDIEGWLQQTPPVHYWLSELLGRRPAHAQTLASWWSRFKNKTEPPIPASLFLAGRQEEKEQLLERLAASPLALSVRAPSKDEVLAFIASALESTADDEASINLERTLAVSVVDVWERLSREASQMILIPLFAEADTSVAVATGHHVIEPFGSNEAVGEATIKLPPPHRRLADEALQAAGVPRDRAYRLSALARRSMPALLRRMARATAVSSPPWSRGPEASLLAPLILAVSWSNTEADRHVAENVAGAAWSELARALMLWRTTADPPFVLTGDQWLASSPEEALLLFEPSIQPEALTRWRTALSDVLLERDPTLGMKDDEKLLAQVRDIRRQYSPALRRGVAQGIALLGAADDLGLEHGSQLVSHSRRAVSELLGKANADDTGELWWGLSSELPLMAEGAPLEFLEAVDLALSGSAPVLGTMFQDRAGTSALFPSSPHTGLLWALETLCWSDEYLVEAARLLAHLAVLDPGGRLSNRPLDSLEKVLVGWTRQTGASVRTKLDALDVISTQNPEIAWRLVLGLLPSHHAIAMPPATPRFRDWVPDRQAITIRDWALFVRELLHRAISLVGDSAGHWGELINKVAALPPEAQDEVITALSSFAQRADLSREDRLSLWEDLRALTSRHRTFQTADWALPEDSLMRLEELGAKIEPSNIERLAFLFDWNPDLPDINRDDYGAWEAELTRRRLHAVEAAVAEGGDALDRLLHHSPVSRHFGDALGLLDSPRTEGLLLDWLGSEDDDEREAAEAWARRKLYSGANLGDLLERAGAGGLVAKLRLALNAPTDAQTWDTVARYPRLKDAYWDAIRPFSVPPKDVSRAVEALLKRDRARAAIDLLAASLHKPDEYGAPSPKIVARSLTKAVTAEASEIRLRAPGYEIGLLLDFLERSHWPAEELAGYEFAFYKLLEDYRRPRALAQALNEQPALFVDLVKRVYLGKQDAARQLTEDEASLARHAWDILHDWTEIPGTRSDGSVDAGHLAWWVREARLALSEADRAEVGDDLIGQVLAASAQGTDGAWPNEAVRDVIEALGSPRLESGLYVGKLNRRGVTSRDPYEGGSQERQLASRYRTWAEQTAKGWRRTSRMLRALADSYEADARRQDEEAALTGDTD